MSWILAIEGLKKMKQGLRLRMGGKGGDGILGFFEIKLLHINSGVNLGD